MVTKSQAYLVIAILDLTYLFITIASYLFPTFQYMNHFSISIFKITFQFHENNLQAQVPAHYLDFNNYFCASKSNMEFKEICSRYSSFYNAAIVYMSLTLFNLLLVLYNFLHFTALTLDWPEKWYWFGANHYLYPILHTLAILVYLWTTNYYGISPPTGFGSDFDVVAGPGLFLMYFAQVFSVCGLFIYLFSRNEATGNESFVEETVEDGYQRIEEVGEKKKLPILPVSEEFDSDEEESEEKEKGVKKEIDLSRKEKEGDSEESEESEESDD